MIFGTDGIRARMGDAPLDEATILRLSKVLRDDLGDDALVIVGSDTRESCGVLRDWVCSRMAGIRILDLGLVPTPVVAFETKARGADLGIMITASHNPAQDNGLKFFNHKGLKLPYERARRWSDAIEQMKELTPESPASMTPSQPEHYIAFVKGAFSASDFEGLNLGFDMANGAGSGFLPDLIADLGIQSEVIGIEPDGHNINAGIGALHPEQLEALVAKHDLNAGFALDGDGDRLVVVAPKMVHGDVVLYALYLNLKEEGTTCAAVVGTIMCGMGFEQVLAEDGSRLIRTPVGDQNVLAEMVDGGHVLGGEPSGHVIQSDLFPAGDGFLGALRLARALGRDRTLIERAIASVPFYPTYEKAYKVRHKPPLEEVAEVDLKVRALREALGSTGRLIFRYSGTEPKLRLYVEAPDLEPTRRHVAELEAAIAGALQ